MTTSAAKQKEIYNQLGFLSALTVLNETELREARHAFSELEREFGEYQRVWVSQLIVFRQC